MTQARCYVGRLLQHTEEDIDVTAQRAVRSFPLFRTADVQKNSVVCEIHHRSSLPAA